MTLLIYVYISWFREAGCLQKSWMWLSEFLNNMLTKYLQVSCSPTTTVLHQAVDALHFDVLHQDCVWTARWRPANFQPELLLPQCVRPVSIPEAYSV